MGGKRDDMLLPRIFFFLVFLFLFLFFFHSSVSFVKLHIFLKWQVRFTIYIMGRRHRSKGHSKARMLEHPETGPFVSGSLEPLFSMLSHSCHVLPNPDFRNSLVVSSHAHIEREPK